MADKVINVPYPFDKQAEFLGDKTRFKLLNCGRRSSKSSMMTMDAMYSAIETQGNYMIAVDTLQHAKEIFWDEIIYTTIPNVWVKKDESELSLEFKPMHYQLPVKDFWGKDIDVQHNPDLPPSKIFLKGVDKGVDRLRGMPLNGFYGDEVAFWNCDFNAAWDKVIRPSLADRVGKAVLASTPDGVMNHFYTFAMLAQNKLEEEWAYYHFTALDNPYFDRNHTGEWEKIRASYERKGKLLEWRQEYLAEFSTPESLVFPNFDIEMHVITPASLPDLDADGFNHFITMDFGWNDPFATLFVAVDKHGNWWIYDEIYERHTDTTGKMVLLKPKMGDRYFNRIIGDSEDPTEIENLRKAGLKQIKPCKKSHDLNKAGVGEIRAQLQPRELTGKPKLFISARCRNLIAEMMGLSYKKDKWGEQTDVIDDRMPDHLIDALKYLSHYITGDITAPPKAQRRYNASGRLIS